VPTGGFTLKSVQTAPYGAHWMAIAGQVQASGFGDRPTIHVS